MYPIIESHNVWGNEFRFVIANEQGRSWYPNEDWYQWNLFLRDHVHYGDTVIDCGAHHGHYTLSFAKQVGVDGKVIAIEADPHNFHILCKNLQINKVTQVTAYHYITSNESHQRFGVQSEVVQNIIGDIETIRLDDIIQSPVHIIKIDVEGYEVKVMQGAQRILAQYHPFLEIEVHLDTNGVDMRKYHNLHPEELLSILGKYHYQLIDRWGQVIQSPQLEESCLIYCL